MAKKLKVEVEAETSKARRKIRRDLGGDIGAAESAAGAPNIADTADKTARSLRSLGDAAKSSASSAGSLAPVLKSFAGVAAGMAASYAAHYMAPGLARTSLGYAGAAISGASTGLAIGHMARHPLAMAAGTLIGGAAGLYGEYKENAAKPKEFFERYEKAEAAYKRSKDFAGELTRLTKLQDDFGRSKGKALLEAQLKAIKDAAPELSAAIETVSHGITNATARIKAIKDGKMTFDTEDEKMVELNATAESLAEHRSKLEALEHLRASRDQRQHDLELGIKNFSGPAFRVSETGVDAISRLGGSFGGGDIARDQLRTAQETNAILGRIEQKTGGGSAFDK